MEFKNTDEFRAWLEDKPKGFSVVIASRSALRVLPVLYGLFVSEGSKKSCSVDIILPVFRGNALSFAATKYPAFGKVAVDEEFAAYAAFAAKAAREMGVYFAADAALAVDAAYAAAYVVRSVTDAAANATLYANPVNAAKNAADAATAADATQLEQGMKAKELARQSLWPDGMPDGPSGRWQNLKKNLLALNEDWQVWIDWYEDILAGRIRAGLPNALAEELDLKIAMQEDAWWKRAPAEVNGDITAWTKAAKRQAIITGAALPKGAYRFERHRGQFRIANDNLSDQQVAQSQQFADDLEDIVFKTNILLAKAKGVDSQFGWDGFEICVERFSQSIEDKPDEIGLRITRVWARLVSLGSFLEMDNSLRGKARQSNASPLDEPVRRALVDVIRATAPMVREFSAARKKDDESGAFLTKLDQLLPVDKVIGAAGQQGVLRKEDVELLQDLLAAARRGEFQGNKAGRTAFSSAKSLVIAMASMFGTVFVAATISAADLPEINKAAELLVGSREQIVELFEDSPDDIRNAVLETINELQGRKDSLPDGGDAFFISTNRPEDEV